MAYIERQIILDARQIDGAPLNGVLRVRPVGTRNATPVLLAGGTREWIITDGALPEDAVIVGGQRYDLAIHEVIDGIVQPRPALPAWTATVTETAGAISVNELYRQARGDVPDPGLLPLYDGDPVDHLAPPDGAADGQVLGVVDGQIAAVDLSGASEVAWGDVTEKPETFTPSAHASTHATGGSDPITAGSIGAATAVHNHDGAYYTKSQVDAKIVLPPGPLAYWRSVRGPGSLAGLVGDSISLGAATPIYPVDGIGPRVAAKLGARFAPDYDASARLGVFMSSPFLESEASHFTGYVDTDPGFIGMTAYLTGPGASWLRSIPGNPGIRWRRFHVRGRGPYILEYGIFNNAFFYKGGMLEVEIDGVVTATIDTSVDPATDAPSTRHAPIARIVADGLADTEHTVVVRATSSAANLTTGTFAIRAYDPGAINLDVYARHDATTDWWGNRLADEQMIDGNFGGFGQPGRMLGTGLEYYDINGDPWTFPGYGLLIYATGINNIRKAGYTVEQARLDLARFLRDVYDPTSPSRNASLMLVLPGSNEADDPLGATRPEMVRLYQDYAEQHNGVFVDMQVRPVGEEWAADFDAIQHAAADNVHPSDAEPYADRIVEEASR